MNPAKSLFHAIVLRMADRLTRDSPDRDRAYLAMVSTLYAVAAEVCGGEWVYIPQTNRVELEQARERIAMALDSGSPVAEIAQRENVSRALVHKVRNRRRGTIRP